MAVTNVKKQGVITGVSELYIAIMTTPDAAGTPAVYEPEIYRVPVLKEVKVTVPQDTTSFFASNETYASGSFISKADLSLTTMKLDSTLLNKLTGASVDANGAAAIIAGQTNVPYAAVGFAATTHNGEQVAYWFPKVQFSLPEIAASTQEDSMSEQNSSFTVTAYPLSGQRTLYISADSEAKDSKIDFDKFFDQVPASTSDLPVIGAAFAAKAKN
ncbi:MAG: major tail protein [Bacilli bacterium]